MADETKQDEGGQQQQAAPWGDKTPEQIWADYQAAQQAAESYKTALGGADPDAAKQGWEWARTVAQQIQEGKLTYAQQQAAAAEAAKQDAAATQTDDFGLPVNYDELSPREQAYAVAKQIQEANKAALAEMVKAEASKYGSQIQDWMGRSEQEKGLLFQVLEASRTNPRLDVKAALEQAAKLKSATPDQLLQMAIDRLSQPDPNANFDERVSAKVAEKLQELENKRMEAAFGISGVRRKVSLKKTPRTREETNRQIMQQWTKAGFSA